MVDLDGNGSLSLEEYNFFEMRTSGEKCDAEAWTICKGKFELFTCMKPLCTLTNLCFNDWGFIQTLFRQQDT